VPLFEKTVALDRMETLGINAARINLNFVAADSFFHQFILGALGWCVDQIHLVVIPEHEFPSHLFHEAAAGENLHILGNRRVVSAGDGYLQEAGDGQGRQADRARCRRMDVVEALPVAVVEHFQQRRVKNFLLLVFRQFIGANGRKMNTPFCGLF
jgi:hypothetical protein